MAVTHTFGAAVVLAYSAQAEARRVAALALLEVPARAHIATQQRSRGASGGVRLQAAAVAAAAALIQRLNTQARAQMLWLARLLREEERR